MHPEYGLTRQIGRSKYKNLKLEREGERRRVPGSDIIYNLLGHMIDHVMSHDISKPGAAYALLPEVYQSK